MSWETVDALGSILGGVFGGCAFFATLILLVHEIRTRRAAEEDEQAGQARLIVSAIRRVGDRQARRQATPDTQSP